MVPGLWLRDGQEWARCGLGDQQMPRPLWGGGSPVTRALQREAPSGPWAPELGHHWGEDLGPVRAQHPAP